jgi:TatD DNase family protein
MIEAFLPKDRGTAVFHWFTGSASEARRAAQLGCYFSVNSEMLKSEPRRALVASLPRERILTETDGPFTMTAGHPSSPLDVEHTIKTLADMMGTTVEAVKSVVVLNLQRLEGGRG